MGYHFSPKGLMVAKATRMKFVERATRLDEQERLVNTFDDGWVGLTADGKHNPGFCLGVSVTTCGSVSGFSLSHETQSDQAQTQQG